MYISLLSLFDICLYSKLHLQDVKIQCKEDVPTDDVDVIADHDESIHIDKVLEVKVNFVGAGLLPSGFYVTLAAMLVDHLDFSC